MFQWDTDITLVTLLLIKHVLLYTLPHSLHRRHRVKIFIVSMESSYGSLSMIKAGSSLMLLAEF
jgi:hypothetical protein